jgi:urease accessory protein
MVSTTIEPDVARLRLLHLVSPSLPVGAFTYSQGLEWAVECGWVGDEAGLKEWLGCLMHSGMTQLEIPLLARLYQASADNDDTALAYWSRYLLACRETRELREEERNRGRALASLLPHLGIPVSAARMPILRSCQLAGFALAAQHWNIPLRQAAEGYLWGWLENTTLAGVKIVPLGQTAGQQIIAALTGDIPRLVERGLNLDDEVIGASCPAQALASSLHETQYTRLYRS